MWLLRAIFLALLPCVTAAQLTPVSNVVFRGGITPGFTVEGEPGVVAGTIRWNSSESVHQVWNGSAWVNISGTSIIAVSSNFVAFTSEYWSADSTTNYTPRTTFESATDALFTNVSARLDSNVWTTADSTTNYARRTGESFSGPVTSTAFFGGGQGLLTEAPITVLGTNVGLYTNNQIIAQGTSFQTIFSNMLQTLVNPTYSGPSFGLSFPDPTLGNKEVGTSLTPQILPSFTKNDAGLPTNYVVTRNSVTVFTNTTPILNTYSNFTIGDETVTYAATVFYSQGPIKSNNFGEAYLPGRIPAGSLSASGSFVGRRKYYLGHSTSAALLTDAAGVKALNQNNLITVNNQAVSITAPAGTRRVVLAYPFSEGALTFAKANKPNDNTDVLQPFTDGLVTNISVGGVGDFDPIAYRVYHWIPAQPPTESITFSLQVP